MRTQRILRVGTIAALSFCGALSAGCARSRPNEAASMAPPPAPAPGDTGSASAPLDPRTYGWKLGRWYAYPLAMTTTVTFGDAPNAFDFDLNGLVQITPTSVTPENVTVYVAIAKPQFKSRVAGSQGELDKVGVQMASTGCFFTFSGGLAADMRAPRALSPTAANAYRAIGAALQFARPLKSAESYTAEEYDTTGKYVAEYRRDADPQVWHKRKTSYLSILAAKGAPMNAPARIVPRIDTSDGNVRLLAEGRPESIELRDAVTVLGAQQTIHSTTLLSLHPGPPPAASEPGLDWSALIEGMQRTAADEPYGGAATVESLDAARIHGLTFDGVVAELERRASDKTAPVVSAINGSQLEPDEQAKQEKQTGEEGQLYIALAAILREQKGAVAAAVKRIKAKSPVSDVLIEALGSASSAASQSALVELAASSKVDPKIENRILLSLSRAPKPDPKSIALFEAMLTSDPFNEQALFGLGTYSRRLRDAGEDKEAARLGDLLVDRLARARAITEQLVTLRAITNSGFAPALPKVAGFLTDEREEIRVVAVRALQSMADPKVDGLIAERVGSDASRDVRLSALNAAKIRDPGASLTEAVESAAVTCSDPHVRYRAVEVLLAWAPRRPDVRATLEQVANHDAEDRIRDRAKVAL